MDSMNIISKFANLQYKSEILVLENRSENHQKQIFFCGAIQTKTQATLTSILGTWWSCLTEQKKHTTLKNSFYEGPDK